MGAVSMLQRRRIDGWRSPGPFNHTTTP